MTTRYEQLVELHKRAAGTGEAKVLQPIPLLLANWGLRPRDDDGTLLWTNLSVPASVNGTIAVGLRYKKRDGSLTEDVFEVNSGTPDSVIPYYRGEYQVVRPEYAGTHKLQDVPPRSFTSTNTCCLFLDYLHGS